MVVTKSKTIISIIVVIAVVSGAWITVNSQFDFISRNYGKDYVQKEDFGRHRARVEFRASEPYRYRIFSTFLQEWFLRVSPFESEKIYETNSFVFRILQNIAIFLMAFLYFRSFRFSVEKAIVGLAILAYAMSFAFWQADLSCHIYSQVAFMLFAGLLINYGNPLSEILILPLVAIAALNREETVFIPMMFLAARGSRHWPWLPAKRQLIIALLSLGMYFVVYFGVRQFIDPASYSRGRYGVSPGMANFYQNLLNYRTWFGLAQMYCLLPIALLFWRNWAPLMRRYLIVVGVPWFLAQFVFGATDETRLFLGPVALIMIPAVLSIIDPVIVGSSDTPPVSDKGNSF